MASHETTNTNLEKGVNGHGHGHHNHNGDGGAFINRNVTPGGHTVDYSQPAFPNYHRKLANPAPLGLCGFALTTFMLSLINAGTRGVSIPNVVVGPAMAYGGLAQLLAGQWEFATGNTFGATAFSSYGGFWIAYAFIVSDWSGIATAYEGEMGQMANGVAFFLLGWTIFTFLMLIASLRSSIALASVFFFLVITFALLTGAEFTGNSGAKTAGGIFGLITAFNAWYVALANLLTPDTSYFVLPTGPLKRD